MKNINKITIFLKPVDLIIIYKKISSKWIGKLFWELQK